MSTHNIPFFQYKKENLPKLSKICKYGICSKGLKNEFETAVVNEPSVFQPLKFCCIQQNFSGSNTDGSFTTAVSNPFLSPLEKNPITANVG